MIPDVQLGEQSAFQRAGIACPGDRPWLGLDASEANCAQPLVGALINQTNIYFPRTISAITLPSAQVLDDAIVKLRVEIERDTSSLGVARTIWNMGNRAGTVALITVGLTAAGIQSDPAQVESALESLFDSTAPNVSGAATPQDPELEILTFRRAEFNMLRNEMNDPERAPDLRVIPTSVPEGLEQWLSQVNLVERLRETRAFFGFDRLEQSQNPLASMPDSAMRQLFRDPPARPQDRWLPAVEVFGEGIYIELREDSLSAWQAEHSDWLLDRLSDGFVTRLAGVYQTLAPLSPANRSWASRYLLVHSLAHILINQLVFECGYSTASLRERLYISDDQSAPMAGLLIYTAAGDVEGTLGGLVRLGRPEHLGPVFQRALSRASWCSADPICSEHLGGQGARLVNHAACQSCVLLPETSCETINHGLDRAMVVGTPGARERGFLSAIATEAFTLA